MKSAAESIEKYAAKYRRLTLKEERALAMLSLSGDQDSKEKLVKHNLMYALKVARAWIQRNPHLEDDIVQGAMMGLHKATKSYNGSIKFTSFAVWYIRQGISREIEQIIHRVNIPRGVLMSSNAVSKACESLSDAGRTPTVDEVHRHMGGNTKRSHVEAIMEVMYGTGMELDSEEYQNKNRHDIVGSDIESPDWPVERDSTKALIEKTLALLKPREEKVLRMYFGIDMDEAMSLAKIGEEIGVTPQAVSCIVINAKKKLNGTCTDQSYDREKFRFFWERGGE